MGIGLIFPNERHCLWRGLEDESGSQTKLADEVGALVFDLGSHTSKIGYAGEDAPKVVELS
jgi:hypothetical protein